MVKEKKAGNCVGFLLMFCFIRCFFKGLLVQLLESFQGKILFKTSLFVLVLLTKSFRSSSTNLPSEHVVIPLTNTALLE